MPELAGGVGFIPPPPTPPHKGEGDSGVTAFFQFLRLDHCGVAARFPSPLWGGARGGGNNACNETILFLGNSPAFEVEEKRERGAHIHLPLVARG